MIDSPIYKDVVLLGGGHAHVQVIKMWAMNPLAGVRLSLVSNDALTPYSGMLPGFVSGHYSAEEMHIDLRRLCEFSGVRFIQATIEGLDLSQKQIQIANRSPLGFDLLSINTGITPRYSAIGAEKHSIPVKPISEFSARWISVYQTLRDAKQTLDVGIVGGGAAGVELVLAMQHACKELQHQHRFHIFQKNSGLPEAYPQRAQTKIAEIFTERSIQVHAQAPVESLSKTEDGPTLLNLGGEKEFALDHVFWCTQAAAASWPKQSDLDCDAEGFIAVDENLRSKSHDFVFAAGDIARQATENTPRAGVFAVRQGPVLFENLQATCLHHPLKRFKAQKHFLRLISCGDQRAIACKPGTLMPTLSGASIWRWKDRIDRKFMAMFNGLDGSTMKHEETTNIHPAILKDGLDEDTLPIADMRCGGCGAKVAADTLSRVISSLSPVTHDDIVLGLHTPDDASAIQVPAGQLLVQSVDVFRALLDDPYLLGKIAAHHALSDLFAMNAQPHSAMAIVSLPFGSANIVERDLQQVMSGALEVLNENNCALIGGHTSEAQEMSVGFSVNGYAKPEDILRKNTIRKGDCLILTQALGTGVLFAAHSKLQCKGQWLSNAIDGMLLSNREGADILHRHQASACTDVTGFGLVGHVLEMLKHQDEMKQALSIELELKNIPVLQGVQESFQTGSQSSLHLENRRVAKSMSIELDAKDQHAQTLAEVVFDPQTSGGLLASVPASEVEACLRQLHDAGYTQASAIGTVRDYSESPVIFRP